MRWTYAAPVTEEVVAFVFVDFHVRNGELCLEPRASRVVEHGLNDAGYNSWIGFGPLHGMRFPGGRNTICEYCNCLDE